MNYETLKAAVIDVIKTNGNEEITGQILQDVLVAIINSLGADYQFAGVATPETEPGTLDQRVFYIASAVGEVTFPNFGPLTIEDKICILKWDSAWSVEKVIDLTAEATEDSEALITSGGVYSALQTLAQEVEDALADLEEEVAGKINKSDAETLAVGSAQGILAQSAVEAFFTYRETQARGAGAALIQTIKGKTIAWNQLVQNGNFESTDGWSTPAAESFSVLNNVATVVANAPNVRSIQQSRLFINGHKYYGTATIKSGSTNNVQFDISGVPFGNTGGSLEKKRIASIITWQSATTTWEYGIRDTSTSDFQPYTVENVMIVDLTLMFGAGNEPSTVAQFEALYPELYYPYNAGKLRNNDAQGLETIGFNQWDEVWEVGTYNSSGQKAATDDAIPENSTIRCKNLIRVLPGNYYANTNMIVFCYDTDGNYIAWLSEYTYSNFGINVNDGNFTIPQGVAFITFRTYTAYGTTYHNDICINLSDASRNGQYEPYWKREIQFRIKEVTGVPVGGTEADRVTIFPNGLGGAGSAFDSIFVENGVTKARGTMARVNLGDLTWARGTSSGTVNFFYAGLSGGATGLSYDDSRRKNVIGAKYTTVTTLAPVYSSELTSDKTLVLSGDNSIAIRDDSYSDADTFKAAMDGVYLEYELATPIVYTDLRNADGTPFELPLGFKVEQDGTEKVIYPEGATEPSAPFSAEFIYPVNPIETCGESLKNLLEAMKTAGVISAYTMTWNEDTQQYEFTITA